MPSSALMYYLRLDDNSLDEDEPVSAYRAWATRNNALHLLDEFCQHRINWVRGFGVTHRTMRLNFSDAGDTGVWSQAFIHTWPHKVQPANLDINVIISSDTTFDADITYRIIPHFRSQGGRPSTSPYGAMDRGAPELFSNTISAASLTTSGYEIDEQITFDTADATFMLPNQFGVGSLAGIDESGEFVNPIAHIMRFEIEIVTAESDAGIYFERVHLREYSRL